MIVETTIKLDEKELEKLLHTLDKSYFFFQEALDKNFNPMMKESKSFVRRGLSKGNGIDTGRYVKSLKVVNSSDMRQDYFCYQVAAKKPHYRLTHLLENGHKIGGFYKGRSKKERTKAIPHISLGQDYVEQNATNAIVKAIDEAFEKGE